MAPEISIDRDTGSIRIGDVALMKPHQLKGAVEPQVANLLAGSRDQGNGYEWLNLRGLTFGGQPASLSICFHDDRFEQASWSVVLTDVPTEADWPTRDAIDSELSFVREALARDMDIHTGQMPWGEVWSHFDAKGFMAANGLRYRNS
jgi:hypothetical protein